jgi:hypothetical protein
MKAMKKTTLLFACIMALLFCTKSFAQQSSINIMDLVTLPVFKTDSNATLDSMDVMIYFKINEVQNALKAHLKIGTVQNTPDILDIDYSFSQDNTGYALGTGNSKTYITNNAALIPVKLTFAQYQAGKYITLQVEDNSGLLSNLLEKIKN